MLNPALNKHLHALLSQLNLMDQKADLVAQFTNGRTMSSKEMSIDEARALIKALEDQKEQRTKKMRAKIIHLLCLLGMTLADGSPDYPRINRFVSGIGSRNPKRKNLLFLDPKETWAVLCQVEQMYAKELKR